MPTRGVKTSGRAHITLRATSSGAPGTSVSASLPSMLNPMSRPRIHLALAVGLMGFALLFPGELRGQDGDYETLPAGRLRAGVTGIFLHADQRFTADGTQEELATDLRAANGASLFPGNDALAASLREILGDPGYTPLLGETRSYLQASQVRVPFTAELGVTGWLTLGVTVPLVKSRTEGSLSLLPAAGADLGENPAFARAADVQAFVDQLSAGVDALPAGEAATWGPWVARWIQAYGASAVFPAVGTPAGDALSQALADFNAVLAGAGVPQVTLTPPLAEELLTTEAFRTLRSSSGAHFQLFPLPTQLLWTLGDVRVHGRLRLLEGPPLARTGRPAWGLTALGTLRLPTGTGEDPRALYDIPTGEGLLGFGGGAAGWLRSGRVGVSAMARYEMTQAGEVSRRVAPPGIALIPASNLRVVERAPGDALELEVRPSFSMAPALWIEGVYRYARRDPDVYRDVGPLPGAPAVLLPYPSGELYAPASVLGEETGYTLHRTGGGLRYHPPAGEFPVEAWVRVEVAIAGSGGQTLKETWLEFGGRFHRSLWGR